MTDRSRLHRGREVLYTPTAAEVTALGAGPWPALITKVNADGTCDLAVDPPGATAVGSALASPLITSADPGAALASPLITNANATDTTTAVTLVNEIKTKLNSPAVALINDIRTLELELKTDVNTMATEVNTIRTAAGRKASVRRGGGPGQFTVDAGSASI